MGDTGAALVCPLGYFIGHTVTICMLRPFGRINFAHTYVFLLVNAKLADALRTVTDGRAAAIVLADLVQQKLPLDPGLPENISRIYIFRPHYG
jgi:hypothetical protein